MFFFLTILVAMRAMNATKRIQNDTIFVEIKKDA